MICIMSSTAALRASRRTASALSRVLSHPPSDPERQLEAWKIALTAATRQASSSAPFAASSVCRAAQGDHEACWKVGWSMHSAPRTDASNLPASRMPGHLKLHPRAQCEARVLPKSNLFCATCSVIQPARTEADYFELLARAPARQCSFPHSYTAARGVPARAPMRPALPVPPQGLPRRFDVNLRELEDAFRHLQRHLHPDKFTTKDEARRVVSQTACRCCDFS